MFSLLAAPCASVAELIEALAAVLAHHGNFDRKATVALGAAILPAAARMAGSVVPGPCLGSILSA